MTVQMDPVTAAKLAAFGRRRRRLIAVRGLCAGVLTLLGAMTIVAVIDLRFMLADQTRLLLSALAYLSVIAVVWSTCLRLVLHVPSPRKLARLLESTQPELREDLVSAVELAEPNSQTEWDSQVFRMLLQESVAKRMRDLSIDRLLPPGLIRWWVRLACVAVVACVGLMLVPGLQFHQLMARAFVPMANVGRVSDVTIAVLTPNPADAVAPQGEVVPVVVQLAGPDVDEVVLEIYRAGQTVERARMVSAGQRQFAASIQVNREDIRYRVTADRAQTEYFNIVSRERPYVAEFHKTYTYPDYTDLDPQTAVDKNGDLAALEGTQAHLVLQTNQPVTSAHLVMHAAGQESTIPLAKLGKDELEATVELSESGTYRVHLVAKETGFENKFSPEYEVRAVPDLAPRVELTEPATDLLAPPDEIIPVVGKAVDDLALQRVVQAVRVNSGEWFEVLLREDAGEEAIVRLDWDLYDMSLQAGDLVLTKLVAFDRKGNRGESKTVRVVVSADSFDPQRLRQLAARTRAHDAMARQRDAASAARKSVEHAARETSGKPADDLDRRQALADADEAIERYQAATEEAWQATTDAIRDAHSSREAQDLVLQGRVLSQIKSADLPALKDMFRRATLAAKDESEQSEMPEAKRLADQSASRARDLAAASRLMLSADAVAAVAADLSDLDRQQRRALDQARAADPEDPRTWERLARRQQAAAAQLQLTEQTLLAIAERNQDQVGQRAAKAADQLQEARQALEQALEQGEADPQVLPLAQQLRRGMQQALEESFASLRERRPHAAARRTQLAQRAGPTALTLQHAREQAAQAVESQGQSAEGADAQAERARAAFETAARRLEDRASIEEARRDADSSFVADLSRAAQAARAIGRLASVEAAEREAAAEPMKRLEQAVRVLDAGRTLGESAAGLSALATAEDRPRPSWDQNTSRPLDWDAIDDNLNRGQSQLAAASLPKPAIDTLGRARAGEEARRINQEMSQRPQARRAGEPLAQPLRQLARQVASAQGMIAPQLAEARATIAELTPSLSERLAGLANDAQRQEQRIAQAAQTAQQDTDPGAVRADVRELARQQREMAQAVEGAVESLRREANEHDIFTAQGRERARDADDAVAMLDGQPQRVQDALRDAATAAHSPQQQQSLTQAAQQQGEMAQTLRQLAQHFENAEAGRPEATRAALREAEQRLGVRDELDAQYNQLARLADLARTSPQEMLAELERELDQNRPMRRELSDIAADAATQARSQLRQSATRERQIHDRLGQTAQRESDAVNPLAQQLADLGQRADQLAQQNIPAARQSARQGGAENAQPVLAQAQGQLQQASKTARQAAQARQKNDASSADLAKQAEALAQPLNQAAANLKQAAQAAGEAAAKQPAPTPPQAQSQARSAAQAAQQAQSAAEQAQVAAQAAREVAKSATPGTPQARQAQAAAQNAERAAQQAQRAAQQADQASQQATRSADNAQQSSQPNQAASAAQQATQQAAKAVRATDEAAQAAEQAAAAAQQAADAGADSPQAKQAQQSAQNARRIAETARAAAQAATPPAQHAQAAQSQAQRAARQAEQLAQQAQKMAAALNAQTQQSDSQLASAARQQPPIAQSVAQAAEDIARAARHEGRLQNQPAAEALEGVADAAEAIASKQLPSTQQALAQADNPEAARPAVQSAETAIAQQADALAQVLQDGRATPDGSPESQTGASQSGEGQTEGQGSESSSGQGGSNRPGDGSMTQGAMAAVTPEAARHLAHALDALDRNLLGQPAATPGQGGEPGQGEGGQPSSPEGQGQGQATGQGEGQGEGQGSGPGAAAASAAAQAAQAQAAAMAAARSQGGAMANQPGQSALGQGFAATGSGAAVNAGAVSYAELPPALRARIAAGDWGKLPPRLAKQLLEGQREAVAAEYRQAVEAYFRAVAEKANERDESR